MTNDGMNELRYAIVKQAVQDYQRALIALEKVPNNSEALRTVRECENFFHSQWYYALMPELDGEIIIEKMKARVTAGETIGKAGRVPTEMHTQEYSKSCVHINPDVAKAAVKELGLPYSELSKRVYGNTTATYRLNRAALGDVRITRGAAERFAKVLGVEFDELVDAAWEDHIRKLRLERKEGRKNNVANSGR